MKNHRPYFVPEVATFTRFLSRFVPKVAFSFFLRQFYDFTFSLKFLLLQPSSPSKKSTFVLNLWLFHWKNK